MIPLKLLSKQWIVDEDNNIIISEGRKEILETIERTGSINRTSKTMKMSYKGVWSRIKATEEYLKGRIVDTDRKLGSRVTKEGKVLLEKYKKLKKECMEADDRIFMSIFKPPPLVLIVGKSGSGKTTLMEKLIPELKRRGLKVGTIKHHHGEFEADTPGKDSWRHKQAGATKTVISSPYRIGIVTDVDHDHRLDELIPFLGDVDIIVAEGYKSENWPKVEIFRSEVHDEPLCLNDHNLIAIVSDWDFDEEIQRFALDEAKGLSDFIITHFELENV